MELTSLLDHAIRIPLFLVVWLWICHLYFRDPKLTTPSPGIMSLYQKWRRGGAKGLFPWSFVLSFREVNPLRQTSSSVSFVQTVACPSKENEPNMIQPWGLALCRDLPFIKPKHLCGVVTKLSSADKEESEKSHACWVDISTWLATCLESTYTFGIQDITRDLFTCLLIHPQSRCER